jgi:hypothetical protein
MKLKVGDLIGFCSTLHRVGTRLWTRWDGEVGLVMEVIDEENFKVKWRHPDGTHSVSIEGGDLDSYQHMKDILETKDV